MPLLKFSIQNTSRLLKTSFVIITSAMALSAKALDLTPNKIKQEFEDKLTSQAFLQSTLYFARGYSFQSQHKWNTEKVFANLISSGYRKRLPDQVLLASDFTLLEAQDCSNLLQISLEKSDQCLLLKNKDDESYVIHLTQMPAEHQKDNDLAYQQINQIYKLDPLAKVNSFQTDPILVAQFRNNEPIMHKELKLADYPVQCLNAVIAIEDNDFLDHSGISYTGLARAVLKNIITMRKAQGGSTITQQLVKNYFLTPEKTFTRKAKEIFMATKLETLWSKDEILQTYLNVIYMGQNGAFQVRGFGSASEYYFNKPIQNLNLSECALLAAIINNPGLNNPWKKTDKAKTRRKLVLSKMKELKLISETEFIQADNAPMPTHQKQKANETAPYFFEAVRKQAQELNIPTEGVSFYTSLDLDLQEKAQKSLQQGISELTDKKKSLANKKEKGLELQGVILSADNHTGLITTFVGGQSFRQSQFNRALYSKRQIGSLIKPFVYLTGLEFGYRENKNVNPMTILKDEAFNWKYDKKIWTPENYDRKYRGDVPYFYALKESLNSPTAQIAESVQIANVIENAYKFGLTSKMEQVPSTSLGASQHTPIEILQAYTTIARLGLFHPLSFIDKVKNHSGETIYSYKIFSPAEAQLQASVEKMSVLVGMMKETLISGTAKSIHASGFTKPAAGKTGTTSNGKDVWFAGFTPNITTIVWLGFDQNLPTSLTGAGGAVPIWLQFMKEATALDLPIDFNWSPKTEYREIESTLDNKKVNLIFEK